MSPPYGIRAFRSALPLGTAAFGDPEPMGMGFWSKAHSILSMYLDSKKAFAQASAAKSGPLYELMQQAGKMAGPV